MRPFLAFSLFVFAAGQCLPVTIMKNVGHGDCYVVISDGRVVVIDAGPKSSAAGLISLLKTQYSHYDRIVITHIHSDHVGGLITAEQYARLQGSSLKTDALVSNHGLHDVEVVVAESKVGPLMSSLRDKPVVGMSDAALAQLALNDEHIEVRGIMLEPSPQSSENRSGLVLKVTEIRDGVRRATLFLGDIEQAQQAKLFSHPDSEEIFRDVGAVTLPHHGRPTTLADDFFAQVKRAVGGDVVALHSDVRRVEPSVAQRAAAVGVKIRSTATSPGDVLVNLFPENSFVKVGQVPATLSSLVKTQKTLLAAYTDSPHMRL